MTPSLTLALTAGVLVTASVTPVFTVAGAAAAQSIDLFENLPSNLEVDRPMEAMLRGLGAEVVEVLAPFRPERGAYEGGHRHGNDLGDLSHGH